MDYGLGGVVNQIKFGRPETWVVILGLVHQSVATELASVEPNSTDEVLLRGDENVHLACDVQPVRTNFDGEMLAGPSRQVLKDCLEVVENPAVEFDPKRLCPLDSCPLTGEVSSLQGKYASWA